MKTGKRFLGVIITVVLLISSLAVYSFAEEALPEGTAEDTVIAEADLSADLQAEEADTEAVIPVAEIPVIPEFSEPAVSDDQFAFIQEEISESVESIIEADEPVDISYDEPAEIYESYDEESCLVIQETEPEPTQEQSQAAPLTLYAPVMTSYYARSVVSGLRVSWYAADNAEGYYIYRQTGTTGEYVYLGTTTDTTYTDETVQAGYIYRYVVYSYAFDEEGTGTYSDHSVVVTGCYVPSPTPVSVKNVKDGIRFTWKKVSAASGYCVYRKAPGDSEWTKFRYIKGNNNTSYVDTTAYDGVTYTYKVCAVIKYGSYSYYSSSDGNLEIYRIPCVSNIKVSKVSGGFSVTWSKAKYATYYMIYRKTSGSSWVRLGYSEGTSYTDKTANTSVPYYYTVVAVNATGRGNYIKPGTVAPVSYNDAAMNAMVNKAQYYSSSTRWLILVNCTTNRVGIFNGSYGNWQLYYYWQCSSGAPSTQTCKGQYTINYKGYSFSGSDSVNGAYTCYYYSSFNGAYLFHSTLFRQGTFIDVDARLGMNLSHGCVRLYINNAKWIYNNIPIGTKVVTY